MKSTNSSCSAILTTPSCLLDDAKPQVDGFRGLDRLSRFELDVRVSEVGEHLCSAPEEPGHKMNGKLVYQAGLDVLSTEVRAAHHTDGFLAGSFFCPLQGTFDPVRHEGIYTP